MDSCYVPKYIAHEQMSSVKKISDVKYGSSIFSLSLSYCYFTETLSDVVVVFSYATCDFLSTYTDLIYF